VAVENDGWKVGFQEPFRESVRLKWIIATAGSIRLIFGLGQEQDRNAWIFFRETSKCCQNNKPHCCNVRSKIPPLNTLYIVMYKKKVNTVQLNLRNGKHNTLKLLQNIYVA
jgi:hypothetical protein